MFENKHVVVAGVGRGLGREVAGVAIREGAQVALGARTLETVDEVAKAVDPSGDHVSTGYLDVTDREACATFAANASASFGPIHALVILAALDSVFGGIEDADWAVWRRVFDVNLFGAMYMVEAALPHFSSDGGAVVFVGSQTMYLPPPAVPQAGYSASKAAIVGAMRHMAYELGRRRIRVNNVAPGWMWGPAVEAYVRFTAQSTGTSEEAVKAEITKTLPLGEMATDGDVAEAVAFLASERARGITGQSLLVNAGEFMH